MFLGFAFVAMLGETMPGAPPPAVVAPPALIQAEPPEPRREPDATPPKLLNRAEIFTQENYPFWARDLDEEGTVRFSVDVSAAGAITSCRVTGSSGSASLDVGTCDLITGRGRFLPGRDKAGKAVADSYVMTITWRLVQDELWKVEDYASRVIFSVDPSLLVSGCRVEEEPVDPDFDPRTCAEFRANAQMMVDASPAEFDWNGWDFIVESTQFAGARDEAMLVGKRDGEVLFDRDITRMTIDPEGRITRCETVERPNNPWLDKSAWCDRMMRNTAYEPATDKADRLLTGVKALYLRKKE